ncbi:hypothetical protein [Kordiimonas aestuarii]|uniref:hypothetical protein n=1 Tax=Kordiimonas aestuarii TaxID=1005925 RepID=UPI0021CEED6F|nr:hypothetical protein [Kordiimonas aestuarii]
MLQIFKSEFLRYRTWTLIATLAILAAYAFMAKLFPFLSAPPELTAVSYLLLVGGALLFGFVQMLLHKRGNNWTYLVHRPLPPQEIFHGLALAGCVSITFAIALPWLVMVTGIDAFTTTVVDTRHYTYILFMLFCALTAYLVGTLSALNPSKGSVLLIIFLLMLMNPRPSNDVAQFAPMLGVMGILYALNVVSFKPDLSTHVVRPWVIILMALPMSYALTYGLALSTTVYYHAPRFIMGTHPDNHPVDGTVEYLWSLKGAERVDYALEGSDNPRADYYAKQAELAEEDGVSTSIWTYPRPGQLHTQDAQYALTPTGTHEVWQFSHDEMLMVGRSSVTEKPLGVIGMRGFLGDLAAATDADRFTEVPVMVGERFLATPTVIYQVNFKERRLDIKHQAPAGEHYVNRPQMRDNFVALVTDKHTLLFDPRAINDEYETAEPDYIIAHPAAPRDISSIDTYRLVDGYLFLYRGANLFGFDDPGSVVVHARLGGDNEVINTRHYTVQRHPAWIRHYMEMISPVLHLMDNAYLSAIEPTNEDYTHPQELITRQYPASIYWASAILMVLSALITLMLCRRHHLGRAQTITWAILGGLLSLPAVIAFLLMNPWRVEVRGPEGG